MTQKEDEKNQDFEEHGSIELSISEKKVPEEDYEDDDEVDLFFQRTNRSLSEDDALKLGTAEKRKVLIERVRNDLYKTQRQNSIVDTVELEDALGPIPPSPFRGRGRNNSSMDEENGSSQEKTEKLVKLGTFKGVFIPCLQNILGVILFLRLTWITAQAGVYVTCGIILISAGSTVLTALSLSAVATNGQVAKGGPYFIISRNLGPEVGTAIGLMFYLGTTVAASLYVLGAVESLYDGFNGFFGNYKWEMRNPTSALALMLILATIVRVGVKQVNKAAELFLAVVLFSIASSLLGCCLFAAKIANGDLDDSDRSKASFASGPRYKKDPDTGIVPDAQVLLAIFYPSVTGIMAGSNRSGVLATPSQSIPIGTLTAICVTTFLYLVVVWLFGLAINRNIMYDEQLVVALVAWPSVPLVKAGIVCSTIGAALQSLTGAPRLLFAIASDGTLPFLTRFLLPEHQLFSSQEKEDTMYSPPPTAKNNNTSSRTFSNSDISGDMSSRLKSSMLHRVESSQRLVHNVANKLIRLTQPALDAESTPEADKNNHVEQQNTTEFVRDNNIKDIKQKKKKKRCRCNSIGHWCYLVYCLITLSCWKFNSNYTNCYYAFFSHVRNSKFSLFFFGLFKITGLSSNLEIFSLVFSTFRFCMVSWSYVCY